MCIENDWPHLKSAPLLSLYWTILTHVSDFVVVASTTMHFMNE